MLEIATWDFEGPYSAGQLRDEPGVYVVLDAYNGATLCVDVGESSKVASRVSGHDREECWKSQIRGRRAFAVLYTNDHGADYRKRIEQNVRLLTSPPCGDF